MILSLLIKVNNVAENNNNRLHWYHVSILVFCTDGSTSFREVQINTNKQYVSKAIIENCRHQIIHDTELAEGASIQAISYLGFMTELEFFGKPDSAHVH